MNMEQCRNDTECIKSKLFFFKEIKESNFCT
jgi:hypothetical protein